MKKYNLNNVKGEVIKALVKRMDKSAIRGKWAAYWGKPSPMDAEMEARIATLGDYERCDCYETTIEIDVCREIAAKLADAVATHNV